MILSFHGLVCYTYSWWVLLILLYPVYVWAIFWKTLKGVPFIIIIIIIIIIIVDENCLYTNKII